MKLPWDGTASPSDRWQAHQFVLVDKDGNEHYVYCADFAVSPQADFRYDMENVEDAGYYDSEAAAHIRAIAQNGYWGTSEGAGSLDAVKKMLVDAYNNGEIDKDDYRGLDGDRRDRHHRPEERPGVGGHMGERLHLSRPGAGYLRGAEKA